MSEVVKFKLNAEAELHLAFGTGKECSGIRGPQFLYTLMDRSIAFADPALDAKIQALQPKSGARVSVTMRPRNQWEVKLIPPAGQPEDMPASATRRSQSIQHSNGTPAAPAPAIPVNGQGVNAVELAMKAAIDVCARGQKYAAAKGLNVVFTGEDVRTILNTIQIGMQERR